MSPVKYSLAFFLGIFFQTLLVGTRFRCFSDPRRALNFVSSGRFVYSSPSRRKLCTVEEGVEGAGDQPSHGLHDSLLWFEHYCRE